MNFALAGVPLPLRRRPETPISDEELMRSNLPYQWWLYRAEWVIDTASLERKRWDLPGAEVQARFAPLKALLFALLLFFQSSADYAQKSSQESVSEILRKGEIVAGNVQTAINAHLAEDPAFQVSKQSPEDTRDLPKILVKKDGSFTFDWTAGQQARYLMEELRQGIHFLQSSKSARGMDAIALAGAREYWPKLRDISCHESPDTRYYDLGGFPQFCPEKP